MSWACTFLCFHFYIWAITKKTPNNQRQSTNFFVSSGVIVCAYLSADKKQDTSGDFGSWGNVILFVDQVITEWARQTETAIHPRGAIEDDEELAREDESGCSVALPHLLCQFSLSTNLNVLNNPPFRWWVDSVLEESLVETVSIKIQQTHWPQTCQGEFSSISCSKLTYSTYWYWVLIAKKFWISISSLLTLAEKVPKYVLLSCGSAGRAACPLICFAQSLVSPDHVLEVSLSKTLNPKLL